MFILRLIGFTLIALGILFCITIIGVTIGVPMMLIGLVFVFVGKKRAPIIVQVHHDPGSKT